MKKIRMVSVALLVCVLLTGVLSGCELLQAFVTGRPEGETLVEASLPEQGYLYELEAWLDALTADRLSEISVETGHLGVANGAGVERKHTTDGNELERLLTEWKAVTVEAIDRALLKEGGPFATVTFSLIDGEEYRIEAANGFVSLGDTYYQLSTFPSIAADKVTRRDLGFGVYRETAVYMIDVDGFHDAVYWHEMILDLAFPYSNSNRLYAFHDGNRYTLTEAFEQELLTYEELRSIHGYYNVGTVYETIPATEAFSKFASLTASDILSVTEEWHPGSVVPPWVCEVRVASDTLESSSSALAHFRVELVNFLQNAVFTSTPEGTVAPGCTYTTLTVKTTKGTLSMDHYNRGEMEINGRTYQSSIPFPTLDVGTDASYYYLDFPGGESTLNTYNHLAGRYESTPISREAVNAFHYTVVGAEGTDGTYDMTKVAELVLWPDGPSLRILDHKTFVFRGEICRIVGEADFGQFLVGDTANAGTVTLTVYAPSATTEPVLATITLTKGAIYSYDELVRGVREATGLHYLTFMLCEHGTETTFPGGKIDTDLALDLVPAMVTN